jgi:inner membrane protein
VLTAHLPSGYVLARALPPAIPALIPVPMPGAEAPDIDIIWFHFVDEGAINHYRYWVHIPVFWAVVVVTLWFRRRARG